jgi:hypothetical protein
MALVNPKGNGTKTVQIPAGYKRFKGSQDPATNNGQDVDSVRLQSRDGLILVRNDIDIDVEQEEQKRPKPPVLSVR